MDDMNAFERQLARDAVRDVGPIRPVDDLAIFDTIAATQSPMWRFQSMFSATKFVVAGAIVALFGGFLLAGVLTQQPSDERLPAVGASASATTQAEPTDSVTSEPEPTTEAEADATTTTSDLLPGVDLVTEEIEPGVYRVVSDGVRHLVDLSPGYPAEQETRISSRNVVTGQDGSVWLIRSNPDDDHESSVFFRLGAPAERADWTIMVYDDAVVGPDGVMWVTMDKGWDRRPEVGLRSWDGAAWSDYLPAEDGGVVTGVEVTSDGAVWTTTQTGDRRRMSAAKWDEDEWQRLGGRVPANAQRPARSWGHHVSITDDGDVWLLPSGNDAGIFRNSGSGWKPIAPPSGWTAFVGHVGRDGTLWATLHKPKKRNNTLHTTTRLGRFDGEDWQVFGKGERFPVEASIHRGLPPQFEVADDGRLWLLNTGSEDDGVWCGGVVNFDGTSWVRLLDGLCIYDADLAPDGSLWLEAGEVEGPIHTYVITPEAVVATEPMATEPPSVDAPAEADSTSTTTSDLLPGVDLVTEEVEPGVYRVLSDGVRDLGWGHGGGRDGDGIVHAGLDGSVVLSFTTGSPCNKKHCVGYRLGETETFSTRHERLTIRTQAVGPDGTIWGYASRQGDGSQDLRYWDGDRWVVARKRGELGGSLPAFDAKGNVYAIWQTTMGTKTTPSRNRLARRTDEGWQKIRDYETGGTDFLKASPHGGLVLFSDGDQVYQVTESGLDPLREAAEVPLEWPWMIGLANDGTELWTVPKGDLLGRFDGSTWETIDVPPDFCLSGAHFAPDSAVWVSSGGQGCPREPEFLRVGGETSSRFLDGAWISSFDIDADGRVWALAADETQALDLFVITPEAVAATE